MTRKLALAQRMGATCCVNASPDDAISVAKKESSAVASTR